MKTFKRTLAVLFSWVVLHAVALGPFAHARGPTPAIVSPIGDTHSFRGILRAKDLRLGTFSLGSPTRISRVLAIDAASRLQKGIQPATLADFAVGDAVEGFAFPDPYGRMVVAVATAQARPLKARESQGPKTKKARQSRGSSGGRRRTGGAEPSAAVTAPKPAAESLSQPTVPRPNPSKAAPIEPRGSRLFRASARKTN